MVNKNWNHFQNPNQPHKLKSQIQIKIITSIVIRGQHQQKSKSKMEKQKQKPIKGIEIGEVIKRYLVRATVYCNRWGSRRAKRCNRIRTPFYMYCFFRLLYANKRPCKNPSGFFFPCLFVHTTCFGLSVKTR